MLMNTPSKLLKYFPDQSFVRKRVIIDDYFKIPEGHVVIMHSDSVKVEDGKAYITNGKTRPWVATRTSVHYYVFFLSALWNILRQAQNLSLTTIRYKNYIFFPRKPFVFLKKDLTSDVQITYVYNHKDKSSRIFIVTQHDIEKLLPINGIKIIAYGEQQGDVFYAKHLKIFGHRYTLLYKGLI